MIKNVNYYYYAAAAATAIAGILHIIFGSTLFGRGPPTFGIFFMISGLAQLFWALPMIKQWGRIWYYIGIAGTIVLIILYFITRVPNPITHRALSTTSIGIAIEVFQFIYIGITGYMVSRQGRLEPKQKEQLR